MDKNELEMLRKQYVQGSRITLIHMADDPRPIPDGTHGTVECVDDAGQIHCKFDNGRCLAVIPGVDRIEIVTADKKSLIADDLEFAVKILNGLRMGTPANALLRGHSADLHCAIHTLDRLAWLERHTNRVIGRWISTESRQPDAELAAFQAKYGELAYPEFVVMIRHATEPACLRYMGDGKWLDECCGEFHRVDWWMSLPQPPEGRNAAQ